MDKEQFNSLDILEQIEYINKGLETDSLTKVCKDIGIDRATIRKRFKTNGYNLIDNKYSHTDNTKTIKNTVKKDTTKANKDTNNTDDTKILNKRMDSLEQQLQSIIDKLDTLNTNDTTTAKKLNIDDIKIVEGNTVSRAYRINEDIQKEFKQLCRRFSIETNATVTDIINTALIEFIEKYK